MGDRRDERSANEVRQDSRHRRPRPVVTLRGEQLRQAINQSVEGLPNVTRATRANSGDVDVSFSGGRATIQGRGFGHGVGLCQWCARGFALEGRDASQILALMYPGSTVRQRF